MHIYVHNENKTKINDNYWSIMASGGLLGISERAMHRDYFLYIHIIFIFCVIISQIHKGICCQTQNAINIMNKLQLYNTYQFVLS